MIPHQRSSAKIQHITESTLCVRIASSTGHGYFLFAVEYPITQSTKVVRDAINHVITSPEWTKDQVKNAISETTNANPIECKLEWLASYSQRQLIDIVITLIGFDDSLKEFAAITGIDYTRLRNIRSENTERKINQSEINVMYSLLVGDVGENEPYTKQSVMYAIVNADGQRITPIMPFDAIRSNLQMLDTNGNQLQAYTSAKI